MRRIGKRLKHTEPRDKLARQPKQNTRYGIEHEIGKQDQQQDKENIRRHRAVLKDRHTTDSRERHGEDPDKIDDPRKKRNDDGRDDVVVEFGKNAVERSLTDPHVFFDEGDHDRHEETAHEEADHRQDREIPLGDVDRRKRTEKIGEGAFQQFSRKKFGQKQAAAAQKNPTNSQVA